MSWDLLMDDVEHEAKQTEQIRKSNIMVDDNMNYATNKSNLNSRQSFKLTQNRIMNNKLTDQGGQRSYTMNQPSSRGTNGGGIQKSKLGDTWQKISETVELNLNVISRDNTNFLNVVSKYDTWITRNVKGEITSDNKNKLSNGNDDQIALVRIESKKLSQKIKEVQSQVEMFQNISLDDADFEFGSDQVLKDQKSNQYIKQVKAIEQNFIKYKAKFDQYQRTFQQEVANMAKNQSNQMIGGLKKDKAQMNKRMKATEAQEQINTGADRLGLGAESKSNQLLEQLMVQEDQMGVQLDMQARLDHEAERAERDGYYMKRANQIAEDLVDIGQNTQIELQKQGQQLEKADEHMEAAQDLTNKAQGQLVIADTYLQKGGKSNTLIAIVLIVIIIFIIGNLFTGGNDKPPTYIVQQRQNESNNQDNANKESNDKKKKPEESKQNLTNDEQKQSFLQF